MFLSAFWEIRGFHILLFQQVERRKISWLFLYSPKLVTHKSCWRYTCQLNESIILLQSCPLQLKVSVSWIFQTTYISQFKAFTKGSTLNLAKDWFSGGRACYQSFSGGDLVSTALGKINDRGEVKPWPPVQSALCTAWSLHCFCKWKWLHDFSAEEIDHSPLFYLKF